MSGKQDSGADMIIHGFHDSKNSLLILTHSVLCNYYTVNWCIPVVNFIKSSIV